jgi:hypothetical protein
MTSIIKLKAVEIALKALQSAPCGLTLDQITDEVLLQVDHFHSRREAIAVIREGLHCEPNVLQRENLYLLEASRDS